MSNYYRETVVVRHHWSGDHTPYRGMLHETAWDKPVGQFRTKGLEEFLESLPDRTEVVIKVEVVRTRLDLPRWVLTAPHEYGPEKKP